MGMMWIAAVSLGVLILGLLLAPAFDVRLTRSVVNPLVAAALVLAIALACANASAYSPPSREGEAHHVLGVLSGIFGGLGLFFAVLGCARYASTAGAAPLAGPPASQSEQPVRSV